MEIYLVGGAVRDELLNLSVKEKDWVVIGASPQDMEKEGFKPIGKDFPVFLHPKSKEEYALARTERKTGIGHKGFTFFSDPDVSLEDDLVRRDLTINAIAKKINSKNLIDPYGGLQDIKNKVLKKVSDAFAEDPLRVLRVARFKAKLSYLGFTIENNTMDTMRSIALSGELKSLSKERVWSETHKALKEKNPEIYFEILHSCEALPEICKKAEDSYSKTKNALQVISSKNLMPEVIWSVFCVYSGSFEEVNAAFNAPKKFVESSIVLSKILMLLEKDKMSNKEIFDVFMDCDVLRRPERTLNLLPVIDLLSKDFEYPQINWKELIDKIMKVTPDKESLGKSGKNINKHLEEKRFKVFEEVLRIE